MSATPCHLYYDLEVANQSLSDTSAPPSELSFTEVRASAVLANPNEYFMSIVRFSVDTAGSLPVFLPQIDLAQPSGGADFPNVTIYSLSFNYTDPAVPALVAPGITATRNIIYKPHSTQAGIQSRTEFRPPQAPLTIDKATTNYYWVQSFYWWINMVNTTLANAWADLITAVNAAAPGTFPLPPGPPVSTYLNPPYMTWDSELNKATLWLPEALFNQGYDWNPATTANPAKCTLSFNAPLHILFSSFEYVFNSYNPPQAFIIRCYDRRNVGYSAASNLQANAPLYKPPNAVALTPYWLGGGLAMEQLYSTGPTMCPVTGLVFTTSLLPVLPSLIGLPRIFIGASTASQQQSNNNIQNQITDLEVPLTRGDEYLPNVLYSPVAEYRLLDLQSNAPLQAIQISVFWKDIFGQTHPFYLQNGCGATLKVMFRKKAYNNIVPFS
jgi:hypothetical protein